MENIQISVEFWRFLTINIVKTIQIFQSWPGLFLSCDSRLKHNWILMPLGDRDWRHWDLSKIVDQAKNFAERPSFFKTLTIKCDIYWKEKYSLPETSRNKSEWKNWKWKNLNQVFWPLDTLWSQLDYGGIHDAHIHILFNCLENFIYFSYFFFL